MTVKLYNSSLILYKKLDINKILIKKKTLLFDEGIKKKRIFAAARKANSSLHKILYIIWRT